MLLDATLSCDASSHIFQGGGTLVFAAVETPQRPGLPFAVERVARAGRGLDLRAVIAHLTVREVNELWVECGPRLAAAFLEANLVDELILYVAPFLLGADAPPLTALSEAAAKGSLPELRFPKHAAHRRGSAARAHT